MKEKQFTCEDVRNLKSAIAHHNIISSSQRKILRLHLSRCKDCRADTAITSLMHESDSESVDELATRRLIDNVLQMAALCDASAVPFSQKQNDGKPNYVLWWVTAAALLLFGIGAALLLRGETEMQRSFSAGALCDHFKKSLFFPNANVMTSEWVQRSPGLGVQNAQNKMGSDATRTFVTMAKGIELVLEAGAKVSVTTMSNDEVRIFLEKGELMASVNPARSQPAKFVVETTVGEVEVKGTIFSVSVKRKTHVKVLRGKVAVTPKLSRIMEPIRYVGAGEGATVNAEMNSVYSLSSQDEVSFQHRLELLEEATPSIATVGNNIEVPLLVQKDTEIINPGVKQISNVGSLNQRDRSGKKGSLKRANAAASSTPSTADTEFLQLLSDARQRKGAKDWAGALDAYENLAERFPGASQGILARVSAGNIRLMFGDARGALAHYNDYLEVRHSLLREEAMRNKAKALRQLGREFEEMGVLKEFVVAFPNSLHVVAAKARIETIEAIK